MCRIANLRKSSVTNLKEASYFKIAGLLAVVCAA